MASAVELVFPGLFGPEKSTASFTVLPNLPPELREKIWEFMVPQNSVVKIYPVEGTRFWRFRGSLNDSEDPDFVGNTHYKTPAVLQICHESRQVGLRFLKTLPNYPPAGPSNVYFNYLTDTLRVMRYNDAADDTQTFNHQHQEIQQQNIVSVFAFHAARHPNQAIRYLAVDACIEGNLCSRNHSRWIARKAAEIKGLKSITLIHHSRHLLVDWPREYREDLRITTRNSTEDWKDGLGIEVKDVYLDAAIETRFHLEKAFRQYIAEGWGDSDEDLAPEDGGETGPEAQAEVDEESNALDTVVEEDDESFDEDVDEDFDKNVDEDDYNSELIEVDEEWLERLEFMITGGVSSPSTLPFPRPPLQLLYPANA